LSPEEFSSQAGLEMRNLNLLTRALTHRSYVNEAPEALEDNERLEFLGDAALDFLIGAWLFRRFPEMDEGGLTRLRSALVRTEQLARFANEIRLGEALFLGHGEDASGGRERPALLCNAFEALIGALYLDSGLEAVEAFMEPRLNGAVEDILDESLLVDARSRLQMWAQAEMGETPVYHTLEENGPDHERVFLVEVRIRGISRGRGKGHSKQEAAQQAAEDALARLGEGASKKRE
jgi:ribonuclease-3